MGNFSLQDHVMVLYVSGVDLVVAVAAVELLPGT
jgi:hypothetical protein